MDDGTEMPVGKGIASDLATEVDNQWFEGVRKGLLQGFGFRAGHTVRCDHRLLALQ